MMNSSLESLTVSQKQPSAGELAEATAGLPRHIPSLDGLRAVSIMLVFVAHVAGTRNAPHFFDHLSHVGNLGVKVFFAISGFLITSLLLRESSKTGKISLKGFYARRSLRIFPAFYTYIGVVTFLSALSIVVLKPGDLLHAVTFTMNYHEVRGWSLNHLWSLAVEEQFYLLWPFLICVIGPRRALTAAAASLFVVPLIRLAMFTQWHASPTALARQFQAVADALAAGCLLAGSYRWLGTKRWYVRVASSPFFPIIPLFGLALALASNGLGKGTYYIYGQTLANLAIVLGIDHCVRFPTTPIGRLLNSRLLVRIGVLSYSLYLWQELFLNPMDTESRYTAFPVNVGLAVVAALVSYHVIERPFLKIKDRLHKS